MNGRDTVWSSRLGTVLIACGSALVLAVLLIYGRSEWGSVDTRAVAVAATAILAGTALRSSLPDHLGIRTATDHVSRLSLLLVVTIGLPVLTLEVGTRAYLWWSPLPPRTHGAFRATRPPPYEDAEYFSGEFLGEQEEQRRWYNPPGTTLVLPRDYSGRHYNIHDGRRRTVGQPTAASHRLLFFGGSAVFGEEVPDALTLPSRLQARINAEWGGRFRVENHGALTVNVAQQVARLRRVTLEPGDVVIFLDGYNDASQALYHGDPRGWILATTRHLRDGRTGLQRAVEWVHRAGRPYSRAVDLFLDPFSSRRIPEHLGDPETVQELARGLGDVYRAGILEAQRWADSHDATFIHFLQPTLFSTPTPTEYERKLAANPYLIPAGLETAVRRAYAELRRVQGKLAAAGIDTFDLSKALAHDGDAGEFFLDFCHVNHAGNEILAGRVFEALRGVLGNQRGWTEHATTPPGGIG